MALVRELKSEGSLDGHFLVLDVQRRTAKNGSAYLALRIGDRSGEIPMKIWDLRPDAFPDLAPGRVLRLHGVPVRNFNGSLQVEIDGKNQKNITILDEADVVYDDFLPVTPGDIEHYWSVLDRSVAQVKNPPLSRLLKMFFEDNTFRRMFGRVPAALRRHHVYIGGLLEHTVGVLTLSLAAASYYPRVDRDLLTAGAILHDIGKVRTYKVARGFEGTDEGRLIGHLVLGTHMVGEMIQRLRGAGDDFPDHLEEKLLHLLISHHGIMEWGSPVEPLLLEACILHHADNFDAQVSKFQDILRQHGGGEGTWSPYDPNLGRSIYVSKTVDEDGRSVQEGE